MEDVKKIALLVLFIWISAFIIHMIKSYFSFFNVNVFISFITVMSFFLFGTLLNKNRKRSSQTVMKKVTVILLFIFIYMIHYGYISQTIFDPIFRIVKMNDVCIYMLYVLLGFTFVD